MADLVLNVTCDECGEVVQAEPVLSGERVVIEHHECDDSENDHADGI